MMVGGDFPRHPFGFERKILPLLILSWPKLYLVLFMVSFLSFTASGASRPYGKSSRNFIFPVFFLATAFLFSVLLSQNKRMSLEATAYFFAVLFTLHMFALLLDEAEILEPLWVSCSLAVLFLSVKALAWRFSENLDVAAYLVLNNAWVGKLQIAWVLNFFAPFLFARYLLTKGLKSWTAGAAWAASGIAVFILFSRAGSLIFAASAVLLCALHRGLWRKWAPPAAILCAGLLFVAAKSHRMSRYVVSSTAGFLHDDGVERRLLIWKDTLRMFRDHPLTGIGFGAYDEIAFSRYGAPYGRLPDARFRQGGWHAHNLHLHILAETGIIGFAAWVFFLYSLLSLAVRRWRESRTAISRGLSEACLLAFAAFMALSMTENLLAVRVHQSLRMNLTLGFLLLLFSASARSAEKGSHRSLEMLESP